MGAASGRESETPELVAAPEHSALHALLPHILRTFGREPALALTAAYLLVSLAGIFYNYTFFERGFGIPVLTLSQIGDFLVAGLQQPIALALMLSTFVVCWLFDWFNSRSRRRAWARIERLRALPRRSWLQRLRLRVMEWHHEAIWLTQLLYLAVVVVYGWMFVGIYAHHRAQEVRHGNAARVTVRMAGEGADLPATDPRGWAYLGAVSNYVFVYDPASKRALVLPVNAIARIVPAARAESELPPPVVYGH